jgi:hypothetical protein
MHKSSYDLHKHSIPSAQVNEIGIKKNPVSDQLNKQVFMNRHLARYIRSSSRFVLLSRDQVYFIKYVHHK